MKKVAIIDMGTNTFHLMTAHIDGNEFKILEREKVAVKIGMGGINQGVITEEGFKRALLAMNLFKEKIDRLKIEEALAIGTSALRNAVNGKEIVNRIEEETGIKTKIISGLEEAEYIYKGIRAAISTGKERSLIMDIGGGSVEFIIGNDFEIFWSHSFEIGGQRLLERFQKHDPITVEEINSLNNYFSNELKILHEAVNKLKPTLLLGSSGTFDTLSDIYCFENNLPLEDKPETPFDIEAFDDIYDEIILNDRAGRMNIPGMIEMRVDMIVVACCLIKYILTQQHFNQIRVSSYSLKEGVLASMCE
jgi:exopolyphosphatase/guanosine-5'-triphosphate,3'-diphosphate pyrophosphatase